MLHNFKCNIAMSFAQRCSLTRKTSMLGEYGIYGQIRAIKGKYNQIRVHKTKCW